jgi:hypothetical protein
MRRVTIEMILDVPDDASAADAVNEILREQQRSFAPQSCLIDYAVDLPSEDVSWLGDPANYMEGDAFRIDGEEPVG